MKVIHIGAALAAAASVFGANATVYNISATTSPHDFVISSSIAANGFALNNVSAGALTYIVTPFDGGLTDDTTDFVAALRFNTVSLPTQGWEWNYWVQIDAGTPYQVGFGGALGDETSGAPPPLNGSGLGGVPSTPGDYSLTDALAFAQAPATHSFNLNVGQSAKLYWLDDNWGDNTGGISVNVTVVPEPSTYAMALAGLGVLGLTVRRRKGL